mmetsp:Transcript_49117/g.117040  ORF Transcript_49117/g.117040 Transcript_49117/m.117040 type:complete len:439 (+) Transcript_49117:2100-3416(+)
MGKDNTRFWRHWLPASGLCPVDFRDHGRLPHCSSDAERRLELERGQCRDHISVPYRVCRPFQFYRKLPVQPVSARDRWLGLLVDLALGSVYSEDPHGRRHRARLFRRHSEDLLRYGRFQVLLLVPVLQSSERHAINAVFARGTGTLRCVAQHGRLFGLCHRAQLPHRARGLRVGDVGCPCKVPPSVFPSALEVHDSEDEAIRPLVDDGHPHQGLMVGTDISAVEHYDGPVALDLHRPPRLLHGQLRSAAVAERIRGHAGHRHPRLDLAALPAPPVPLDLQARGVGCGFDVLPYLVRSLLPSRCDQPPLDLVQGRVAGLQEQKGEEVELLRKADGRGLPVRQGPPHGGRPHGGNPSTGHCELKVCCNDDVSRNPRQSRTGAPCLARGEENGGRKRRVCEWHHAVTGDMGLAHSVSWLRDLRIVRLRECRGLRPSETSAP